MEVLRDGTFSYLIGDSNLSRGLRPSKRIPRNREYLVECSGAVGMDRVLQVIDDLETDRLDTSIIVDGFPYPQIFVFTNAIIVCGETRIYEWVAGALVLELIVAAGELWSAVDFFEFVYMSNNVVAVLRSATSGVYTETAEQPVARAICNLNGQVHIGGRW